MYIIFEQKYSIHKYEKFSHFFISMRRIYIFFHRYIKKAKIFHIYGQNFC